VTQEIYSRRVKNGMSWSFGDSCPLSNRDVLLWLENALEPRTLVESEGPSQKLEEQQEPSLGNTTDTSVAPNVHEDDTELTPLVSMIASCDVNTLATDSTQRKALT
jgi:hypothetical protein